MKNIWYFKKIYLYSIKYICAQQKIFIRNVKYLIFGNIYLYSITFIGIRWKIFIFSEEYL